MRTSTRRVAAIAIVVALTTAGVAMAQQGGAAARPTLPAPTAFPASGTYATTISVTLLDADPGAQIHYTLDGSVPTAASPTFDPVRLFFLGAVSDGDRGLTTGYTVRAVALGAGGARSDVVTFTYTIARRDRTVYLSEPVFPGVRMIRDADNDKMFLVAGRSRAVLIDSGQGRGALRDYLAPYIGDRPLDVIFTHNHGDHIGQADQFVRESLEYIGEEDRPALVQRLRAAGTPDDVIEAHVKAMTDGQQIDLGDRTLTLYQAHGHTPGSLVVLDEPSGILFTGDSFGSNNAIVPDSAYMQLGTSLPIDRYLDAVLRLRAKLRGKVTAVLTGHNDRPLWGETYLDHVQTAAQAIVDHGVEVLRPGPRPVGGFQAQFGDRLNDPDWGAISVNRDRLLSVPAGQIAAVSLLDVSGGSLQEPFTSDVKAYHLQVAKGTRTVHITPVSLSSRPKALTVNGVAARSGTAVTVPLKGLRSIDVVVTSSDGSVTTTYQLRLDQR
jgi:glyoxylase-like metal-dependent hydrolase (beta-lactamase superfamily II)